VQPGIARYSGRHKELPAHKAADCSGRARARGSLPCRSSFINRPVPRLHPPCCRNAHGDEKEEACPRIRPRIAVAAERREVSAVTFIGYKSTRILCRARVNTFMPPSLLPPPPFASNGILNRRKKRALFIAPSERGEMNNFF